MSVVINSYNHAGYVRQTIQSILDQSFQDFEIVVTDDGSSDGTPDVIRGFGDPRIHLEAWSQNRGISPAKNATIARARGEFVAILDSDDFALPGRLASQVAFLEGNPQIAAVFGLPRTVDEHGMACPSFFDFTLPLSMPDVSRSGWLNYFFFRGNCLCDPTAMVRRSVLQQLGDYDPRYTNLQDFDMWVRLCAGHEIHVMREELTGYRIRNNNANISAPRPDTILRTNFENAQILKQYRTLKADDIRRIFARDFAACGIACEGSPDFWLAELALRVPTPAHRLFALQTMFEAAQSDAEMRRLSYVSGQVDVFGLLKDVKHAQPQHRVQPRDVDTFFDQAVEHHRQGRLAEALALYDAVIVSEPQRGSAHFNRGLVLQSLNKADEALQSFDRAILLDPGKGDAHYCRAVTLRRMSRLDEAVESYDRAIALMPDFADAWFERGNALQRLNRFEESVASYDRAIAIKPDLAEAYNNKGSALRSLRRAEDALVCFDRAIALKPDYAEPYNSKGLALQDLGRHDQALQSFDRAIELKSDFPQAYNNRGLAKKDLDRWDEALVDFEKAIALQPDFADASISRGLALTHFKRFAEAVESFDRAIAVKPDHAEALCCRGNALQNLGQLEAALHNYDRAIALMPDYALAYCNKGTALMALGRLDAALDSLDRAIALKPDYADAYHNRSLVLSHLGRWNEVLLDSNRAIELQPDLADAHCSRGNAFTFLKRFAEAIASYDQAIALKPDYVDAYWNKSLRRLLLGHLDEGWTLYEWRKIRPQWAGFYSRSEPGWTGKEILDGKTLLIHSEQGLGDTIQFCRYAPLARELGAKITLAVQPSLTRLLRSLDPEIEVVPIPGTAALFDYHAALMSLPLAFGTTLESCPANVPYLRAEPERVTKWKERIGHAGFKVGICWQGNKHADVDVGRSFALRHFEGLAQLPNVRLISLQKNDGVEQLQDLPSGMKVETLGEDFDAGPDAFIDTAAVMECLDLVISCDTAVAHLAGALGRAVWVALNYVPDWRWLLNRPDSPWYPTMKLFRQPAPGDWASVFAAIQACLTDLSLEARSSQNPKARARHAG